MKRYGLDVGDELMRTPTLGRLQKMASKDGLRWACGRTVKGWLGSTQTHWIPLEVWSLRHRDAQGKVEVVRARVTRGLAKEWIK